MIVTELRPKRCRVCPAMFTPVRPMQVVCGLACARRVPVVARKQFKAEKQKTKARLDELQPLSYWMKKAQSSFNGWVRFRDISAGYGCIDCGKPFKFDALTGGAADAGHYLSRSHAPHLRFDERNVFAQDKHCNRPGVTDPRAFRAGVVARIGLAAVEALEADQTVKQYRAEDLKAITADYRARLKALQKANA
jgi:hypothetical protein